MTKKLFSCMFAFLLLIPCMFLMTACANGNNDGDKGNPTDSLTNEQLSDVYKQTALQTWSKIGIQDPTASGGNADALSVNITDKRAETTDSTNIQLIKQNAAADAALIYLLGELYNNASFVLTNDIVKFGTTSTIGGMTCEYDFILSPLIDTAKSKIYFEAIVDVTMPSSGSDSADGATTQSSEQYVYAEFDYDFTKAELTAFRFCGIAGGMYIDLGIDSSGKNLIYYTTESTDDFAVAVNSAKTSLRNRAENISELSASFQTECQTYFNFITMMTSPVAQETK